MSNFDPDATSRVGYHKFIQEDVCPGCGEPATYGSFEVFWDDHDEMHGSGPRNFGNDGDPIEPGWYWASGFPGCLWDSDPLGPFATSEEAYNDAQDGA